MNDSIETKSYHSLSRWLHWAVAGMIVVQYVLANLAESAEEADQTLRLLALLANHKSVGITILALVLVRLVWRWRTPAPGLPETMPGWQVWASHISHWTLYLLLLLVPLSGWLMSSASAYSVSWFNLFVLPDLVAPDADLKDTLELVHEVLARVLLVLAVIHILAALKHALVDRDGVLGRMTTGASVALFVLLIAAGVLGLGSAGRPSQDGADPASSNLRAAESVPVSGPSELPTWTIDYDSSHIRFTGDQAGAAFDGEWQSWEAEIQFDPDNLAGSRFDVIVDTRQVNTEDADRDAAIVGPEWFDSENHPYAYYRAAEFSVATDGSYEAAGQLIIKGQAAPVALRFTVTGDGDRQVLETTGQARLLLGQALLDRLVLGLGTGEWADTTWVGQEVTVDVRVEAVINGP
ncbi:MAG: cytochrome b/b6 domain-containing protein [Xanthomonadales bacterium]|nr:cytochrome b/b6 domain-containing protein [Xanthomonadales bacterium]